MSITKLTLSALALLAPLHSALAQDLTPKSPAQKLPIVLTGATIHPVSSPPIENGVLVFAQGRIVAVGTENIPIQGETETIHLPGTHVWPGMIGAYTQLGLTEISSVRATLDMSETGRFKPEVRAVVAVNPDSTLIPVTRTNGILAAGVFPTGGTLSGRAGVIQLEGWTFEDMTLLPDAGLVVQWPSSRSRRGGRGRQPEDEENNGIEQLEQFFGAAKAYHNARRADPSSAVDLRFDAMAPCLSVAGAAPERPVFVRADSYADLQAALAFLAAQDLRGVIIGGRDAHLCTEALKTQDVAVILNGTFRMPGRDDAPYDAIFRLPQQLEEAGVRWCFASGEETAHERNLPYSVAQSVAHGLDLGVAMRSVTLSAAELLGVGADLGSLEVGKLASLIVTDGHPLEVTTNIQHAWIAGRRIDLSSKQSVLAEKYREKYRQLEAEAEAQSK